MMPISPVRDSLQWGSLELFTDHQICRCYYFDEIYACKVILRYICGTSRMAQMCADSGGSGSATGGRQLCLLSIDGGGVRGLSALYILKQLMGFINHNDPPKPCDYFDMIGGTSTGGLIAIMLGRLCMSVDECIEEYKSLSAEVFTHCKHRVTWRGDVQGRFDHEALVRGTKALLSRRGFDENAQLQIPGDDSACKVYVTRMKSSRHLENTDST